GLHGGGGGQARAVRAGPRRDAVPGRDRGDSGRDAGQAAAGPAGVRVRAGGGDQDHQGRRPPGGGDQPRPAGGGGRRRLPRGSVLPAERGAGPHPALARATGRYPFAGRALPRKVQRSLEETDHRHCPRGHRAPSGLPLARQHPRAREPDGADHAVLRRAGDPGLGPAARGGRGGPHLGGGSGAGGGAGGPGHRRGRQGGARVSERGRARRDRAGRARVDPEGPGRDRRQRDPGRPQAEDLPQEPPDEDERAGVAREVATRVIVRPSLSANRIRRLALLVVLVASFPARAAEVTRVVSALDEDDTFDLNLTATWLHDVKSALVNREQETATGLALVKDLKYARTRDVLDMRLDFGVLWDVGLHVDAPLVLHDSNHLDFDSGVFAADASMTNSTTVSDGILAPPSGSSHLFSSPTRKGFESLGLGVTWAVFNQRRDDTKPTWTLGFDAKLDVFKDM